jgi:hypothetical protein
MPHLVILFLHTPFSRTVWSRTNCAFLESQLSCIIVHVLPSVNTQCRALREVILFESTNILSLFWRFVRVYVFECFWKRKQKFSAESFFSIPREAEVASLYAQKSPPRSTQVVHVASLDSDSKWAGRANRAPLSFFFKMLLDIFGLCLWTVVCLAKTSDPEIT